MKYSKNEWNTIRKYGLTADVIILNKKLAMKNEILQVVKQFFFKQRTKYVHILFSCLYFASAKEEIDGMQPLF